MHGKKDIFLEHAGYIENDLVKEQEADRFASNILLTSNDEQEILKSHDYSVEGIKRAASRYGTHPSIIVGRLQHCNAIGYWQDQSLLKSICLDS